jgi:hypothetical protein
MHKGAKLPNRTSASSTTTHSMLERPISGGAVQNGCVLPLRSASLPCSSILRSILSISFSSQFHPRPRAISNTLLGVPINKSTGLGLALCLTSNSELFSPSLGSPNSIAILAAVPDLRGVLGEFARDAQRTRNFETCSKDLAKDANCRDSSWVGAKISARGLIGRLGAGGRGAFSDCLRS